MPVHALLSLRRVLECSRVLEVSRDVRKVREVEENAFANLADLARGFSAARGARPIVERYFICGYCRTNPIMHRCDGCSCELRRTGSDDRLVEEEVEKVHVENAAVVEPP